MKKAAIIGAGLAGLAAAWHLLDTHEVTIFDPAGVGGGASGAATGLLYPFPGKWAIPTWRKDEGMRETNHLLDVAEEALGRPVCLRSGVLRLAPLKYQQKVFLERHAEHPQETAWWSEETVADRLPHFAKVPGLWIPSGVTIFAKLYLQGLFQAVEKRGAALKKEKVHDLAALYSFDHIIVAAGNGSSIFHDFPLLEEVKGQTILCKWNHPPLPFSIASLGHLSPTEDPHLCQIGSTYEHHFTDLKPTPAGQQELLDKAAKFYPSAQSLEIQEARSGIRYCPKKGYRPTVQKISHNAWAITGFGSKGFIYHGIISKELCKMIAN